MNRTRTHNTQPRRAIIGESFAAGARQTFSTGDAGLPARLALWSLGISVLAVFVALLETAFADGFNPTSAVYIDTARHLARGEGVATTVLFPSSVPRVPAPLSAWAPLYPTVLAGLATLGVDVPVAARAISVAAFGLAMVLVGMLGSALFGRKVGALSGLLVAVWPSMAGVAATAGPEYLFVSLFFASLLMSLRVLHQGHGTGVRAAMMGGLTMSAAALTWYPGMPLALIVPIALFVFAHGMDLKQRLSRAAVWLIAAAVPVAVWLARNLLVTGALIGGGRQPDDRGPLYHAAYAARTVVTDGAGLIARVLVLPEAVGAGSLVMVAVVAAAGFLLVLLVWHGRLRRGVVEVTQAVVRSAEVRFVAAVGVGYWGAVVVARSVIGFHPLDTRYLMPVYPLLVMAIVAAGARSVNRTWPSASRFLAGGVVVLCVAGIATLALPRSLAAGGPRLAPEPPPAWVEWVAANTSPDTLIIGNSPFDYNLYLERPVVAFTSNRYGISPRFDCRAISGFLVRLGAKRAYFVLRERESRFDAGVMGSLYGRPIQQLLNGEARLPFRLVARQPNLAAYEVLDSHWECD